MREPPRDRQLAIDWQSVAVEVLPSVVALRENAMARRLPTREPSDPAPRPRLGQDRRGRPSPQMGRDS